MAQRPVEILVVDPDANSGEHIRDVLQPHFPVRVTWAGSCSEALCEELTHRHDLILTHLELPDADGLTLIRELRVSNQRPTILLAQRIDAAQAVEAMQMGVRDVLLIPWEAARLVNAVHSAVEADRRRRRLARRNRRLRMLTTRILKERRDLRERIDLICRDVVRAYGRLAQEVAETSLLRSTTSHALDTSESIPPE